MQYLRKYFEYFYGLLNFQNRKNESDGLPYWSDMLFVRLLSILLPLSFIVVIPSAILSFQHGLYFLAFADIITFILIFLICTSKSIALTIKKWSLVAIIYILAIVLLFILGMVGPGLIYLLALTIVCILILNQKVGYLSILFNTVILLAFNLYYDLVNLSLDELWNIPLESRLVVLANFLFLNLFSVFAISLLLQGMDKTLKRSQNLKQKAEESDRLKSEFLSSMSHEIRTPLNAVVGFSSIIAESNSDPDYLEYSSSIQFQTNLLLKLIHDILDFAKIESNSLELIERPFNIDVLFDELHIQFDADLPNNKTLVVLKPQDCNQITTDKLRLSQVLTNLISNAIKFTQEGEISFGAKIINAKEMLFFVNDTGIGIAKDQQKAIYERFYKVDKLTQGTGLGLSIAKNIVELMGSKLELESEPQKGSRFSFILPCNNLDNNNNPENNAHEPS
jgi:signal transduction histidine kinase